MNRRIASTLAASLLPGIPLLAAEDGCPSRPITIVVPCAAGGRSDLAARVVSQRLSRELGMLVPQPLAGAIAAPEVKSRRSDTGVDIGAKNGPAFAAFIANQTGLYRNTVAEARIEQ